MCVHCINNLSTFLKIIAENKDLLTSKFRCYLIFKTLYRSVTAIKDV